MLAGRDMQPVCFRRVKACGDFCYVKPCLMPFQVNLRFNAHLIGQTSYFDLNFSKWPLQTILGVITLPTPSEAALTGVPFIPPFAFTPISQSRISPIACSCRLTISPDRDSPLPDHIYLLTYGQCPSLYPCMHFQRDSGKRSLWPFSLFIQATFSVSLGVADCDHPSNFGTSSNQSFKSAPTTNREGRIFRYCRDCQNVSRTCWTNFVHSAHSIW